MFLNSLKKPIEKQLEILHSPVVEGFFSDLDIDMKELSYQAFAKKYPEYAHFPDEVYT